MNQCTAGLPLENGNICHIRLVRFVKCRRKFAGKVMGSCDSRSHGLIEFKVGKKAGNTHISQDGGKYW